MDEKAIRRYRKRRDGRLKKRGFRFDFDESKIKRDKSGKFAPKDGSDGSAPELTHVEGLPSGKDIGFKPGTKSKYRNVRDEIVARHKALRKKNGEDGMPDCTVDPDTGDAVNFKAGFQVAFQTSSSESDGEGRVSDEEYDRLADEIKKKTGSKAYVGVFDEAETSFHCESYRQAMALARKHNQHSILSWRKLNKYKDVDWTPEIMDEIFIRNPYYDPSKNHVKGE